MLDLEEELHTAAQSGDANRVQSLIEDGVDVHAPTEVCVLVFDWYHCSTPPGFCGHVQVVQALLMYTIKDTAWVENEPNTIPLSPSSLFPLPYFL